VEGRKQERTDTACNKALAERLRSYGGLGGEKKDAMGIRVQFFPGDGA